MDHETTAAPKKKSGWLNLAIDYGPLLIFFLVYRYFAPEDASNSVAEVLAVVKGTGAFIVAALVALGVSKWKLGHITPMLMLSTALIVFFGGLTIFFQDPVFVQVKPTIIYALFAVALLVGWRMGKPLLKYLLGAAFEGLSDRGWMALSRNWGFYFVALAILNEVLRAALPLLPLRSLTIQGSYVGSPEEMRELMELVRTVTVSAIPVRPRPLGDAQTVLNDLRDGRGVGRMVLTP